MSEQAAKHQTGIQRSELVEGLSQINTMLSHSLEARVANQNEARESIEAMIESIHSARRALSGDQLAGAEKHLAEAWVSYGQAISHRGLKWRLGRMAPCLLVYQVLMFIVIIACATSWWPPVLNWFLPKWHGDVWVVPVEAFGFGGLGAILRSMYWLGLKVSARRYRAYDAISHFGAPFIGALFGALVYLLLLGGLVMLEGTGNNIDNTAVPLAIAFVVGFRWESLLPWLENFRIGAARGLRRPDPSPESPKADLPNSKPVANGQQQPKDNPAANDQPPQEDDPEPAK